MNLTKTNRTKLIAWGMVVIILLSSLFTTSCDLFPNESNGINIGYRNNDRGTGSSPIGFWVACKSDTNEFDIENVVLTFSWGFTIPDSYSYSVYEISFVNDENKEVIIRQVEDDLNSEKYSVSIYTDPESKNSQIQYNYSEDIKIPAELFSKDKGEITFCICVPDDAISMYVTLNYITLIYKKSDDKIILSQQMFRPISILPRYE